MSGEDEVRISAVLDDAISAATARIEARVESLENQLKELGRTATKSGKEVDAGLGQVEDAADDAGKAARRARPPVRALGDEAVRTGAKAKVASTGLDAFADKATKMGKSSRGSGKMIMTAFKFAGVITGVFALAGGLSALGAGGAIALGGLGPLFGVLAGAPGLLLAVKLSMLAVKLAAAQIEQPVTRMKNQFTQLGDQIAAGGLRSGLDYLADSLGALAEVTGHGLAGLGGEIGSAARATGDWVSSGRFLDQVAVIFEGLRPVVAALMRGVLELGQTLLNVVQAALPLTQKMADEFAFIAMGLAGWTNEMLVNGRATAWLNKSWDLFRRTIGVLVDIIIGVYNVLRIGAGYAGEMGLGVENAARQFRTWTGTAEGQKQINQYFQDSLPALREIGKLIGLVVGGLAKLGTSSDVAPLLTQIRTEFAPAVGDLVTKLSGQGGLGPALISAATALVQLMAGLDLSGLTAFLVAIAGLANALLWVSQEVPGANFLISALLMSMLGFKALGPVFSIIGSGAKAFSWVQTATKGVQGLSTAQKMFKGVVGMMPVILSTVGTAFKTMAMAGIGALRALSVALFTTPIGWIILAIIAIVAAIYLLWTKCEWFRDAVTAVWEWIKNAALASWEWVQKAFWATIDAIKTAAQAVADFVIGAWNWIRDAAVTVWTAISDAFQTVINAIVTAAMWLWENGIKPVFEFIAAGAEMYFNIVKFIIQTVIFFTVLIITGLAFVFQKLWEGISAGASWVFDTIIKPIVDGFVSGFQLAIAAVQAVWQMFTTALATAWNWFYNNAIKPTIDLFTNAWNALVLWVQTKWNELTTGLSAAWNAFYTAYIQPAINAFSLAWEVLTTMASERWNSFVSGITDLWNGFVSVASSVMDSISSGWNSFTTGLSDLFSPVGDFINGIWEKIQKGAEGAASIVTGAWNGVVGVIKSVWNSVANGWNSFPSFTVPDFVPGIGGKTFSLPKMPTLWHGGEVPGGGQALVGEHGPEPLVRNGALAGMVGLNGPEVANIPRGGYVVPNLNTLNALPGLTKSLPAGVAAAVARSVPGYAGALKGAGGGSDAGLRRAVDRLADAVDGQMPPVHLHGTSEELLGKVMSAWKTFENEKRARKRYDYTAGRR